MNFAAAIVIPLSGGWQEFKFSSIPPNKNTFSGESLRLAIDQSASPLIYPLPKPHTVTAFDIEIEIDGELKASEGFPEDAYLRVGLVVPGSRRLGAMERIFAAGWIKQLFALAPKNSGVEKVYFYNLVPAGPTPLGSTREVPKAQGLMQENLVKVKDSNKFKWRYVLPKPLEVAALWLSADGDQTKSKFTLTIKSLHLEGD